MITEERSWRVHRNAAVKPKSKARRKPEAPIVVHPLAAAEVLLLGGRTRQLDVRSPTCVIITNRER